MSSLPTSAKKQSSVDAGLLSGAFDSMRRLSAQVQFERQRLSHIILTPQFHSPTRVRVANRENVLELFEELVLRFISDLAEGMRSKDCN